MTRKPNGLYRVYLGSEIAFDNVEFDEGLSGCLTIADHYDGIARVDGQTVVNFTGCKRWDSDK